MLWWNFGFKLSTPVSNTSNSQTKKITAIASTSFMIHMLPINVASNQIAMYLVVDH